MRKPAVAVGLVLALAVAALLGRFGTLRPCGMLKQELHAQLLRTALTSSTTGNQWEMLGAGLGTALGGKMIESVTEGLTPIQCTQALVRVLGSGEDVFGDKLKPSRTMTATAPTASTVKMRPYWRATSEKSPIDDSLNVYLSIDADSTVKGWLGEAKTPSLSVRCKENETDVYVNLWARPRTDSGLYGHEHSTLTVRFDEEKAVRERFGLSTDGEAIFFSNGPATAKKLLNYKKLLIEVVPYNSSPQVVTFDLTGLGDQITPLRTACRW